MSGVGFISKTILGDAYDPVQNAKLFVIPRVFSEPPPYFDLKGLLETGFIEIETFFTAKSCEVVSMDNNAHHPSVRIEATW